MERVVLRGLSAFRWLVARGHSYREIGEELYIAEKTVENHVRNILSKLHLNRRHELVRFAIEHGIE